MPDSVTLSAGSARSPRSRCAPIPSLPGSYLRPRTRAPPGRVELGAGTLLTSAVALPSRLFDAPLRRTRRTAPVATRSARLRPRAGPANRDRPKSRTTHRLPPAQCPGNPSCSASFRASAACWAIMPSSSRCPTGRTPADAKSMQRRFPDPTRRKVAAAARAPRISCSYLPDFRAMSSPNHFACSWASEWQPTFTNNACSTRPTATPHSGRCARPGASNHALT